MTVKNIVTGKTALFQIEYSFRVTFEHVALSSAQSSHALQMHAFEESEQALRAAHEDALSSLRVESAAALVVAEDAQREAMCGAE